MDPSGAFIFLFNINKSAEHPVDCDRPSNFQPLEPPLQPRDIKISSAGTPFLASSSIKQVRTDASNGYGQIFKPSKNHLSYDAEG